MKYCPHCNEQFNEEHSFCDLDGTPLVDEIGLLRSALHDVPASDAPASDGTATPGSTASTVATATIGILVGIVLCLTVYLLFMAPNQVPNRSRNESRLTPTRPVTSTPPIQATALQAPTPIPPAEETASPEAAQSEAASETASAAFAQNSAKPALAQGPISTGERRISEGRTLITMKDGSTVEADAAWEDAQGVWYRRSGLVSFVGRDKVEKMSEVVSRAAAPEAVKP